MSMLTLIRGIFMNKIKRVVHRLMYDPFEIYTDFLTSILVLPFLVIENSPSSSALP